MKKLLVVIILLISFASCTHKNTNNSNKPYVLMLSMDGFRWDYPEKALTPTLDSIEKIGVRANLIPSFPTKTFPNHYSIATGLYPDNHGIILNSFYNYKLNKAYSLGNRKAVKNPDFYNGEPIWVTAEKQGITTASYFWVSSETKINGYLPTYWKQYDHYLPFESIIDSVIYWLKLPEIKRPHLITFYFNQPDLYGHKYGPDSKEIINEVEYLDSLLSVFFKKANKLKIANQLNVIITSDHGMENISSKRTEYLNNYIKDDWIENTYGGNPVFIVKTKNNYYDSVYINLKKANHLSVWKPDEIPKYLHYGNNTNIQDFVVCADSSWSVFRNKSLDTTWTGGTHGYNNKDTNMDAIFYACGPAFKRNYQQVPFENINIYPLITKIMNITPAKTDGKIDKVINMLKK